MLVLLVCLLVLCCETPQFFLCCEIPHLVLCCKAVHLRGDLNLSADTISVAWVIECADTVLMCEVNRSVLSRILSSPAWCK